MTKRSGYRVTITGFLPADANSPDSIMRAHGLLECLDETMSRAGFIAVSRQQRYFQAVVVIDTAPELPMSHHVLGIEDTPQQPEGDAEPDIVAATNADGIPSPGAGPSSAGDAEPDILPMLPALKRGRTA